VLGGSLVPVPVIEKLLEIVHTKAVANSSQTS
jgi:hypothetical protein